MFASFKNEPENQVIDSLWLMGEITKIRAEWVEGVTSSASRSKWRLNAGVCKSTTDKAGNLIITPSPRRKVTHREAAAIVLQGLWDPCIKGALESSLKSGRITPEQIPGLFDQWMRKTGGKEAEKLLKEIASAETLTYERVHNLASDQAKKVIALSTIKRWAKEAGAAYRKAEVCPWEVAVILMLRAQDYKKLAR